MVTSTILRAAMQECGISIERLAAAIGDKNDNRVEGWRNGTKGLSIDALATFPAGLAMRVLARLEEQKRAQAETKRAELPITMHVMRVSAAAGELASIAVDALADGVIDDREHVALRKCTLRMINESEHAALDRLAQVAAEAGDEATTLEQLVVAGRALGLLS